MEKPELIGGEQMEETPYQKGIRILQSSDAGLRDNWMNEMLSEKDGRLAKEALNNFADRKMLSEEEIKKLLQHVSETDDSSLAAIAFGGSAQRFTEEQCRNLLNTVILNNDKVAAQNIISSRRKLPDDLKPEIERVSKEGEKKEQKAYRSL